MIEKTKIYELMLSFLKNITNNDKNLVIAIANPLKTEKMQIEMMDWLVANYENEKMMRGDRLIQKALDIEKIYQKKRS